MTFPRFLVRGASRPPIFAAGSEILRKGASGKAHRAWKASVFPLLLAVSLLPAAGVRGGDEAKRHRGHEPKKPRARAVKRAHGMMKHSVKIVPADFPRPPGVRLRLEKDAHAKGAVNLFLDLRNFGFAPAEVNRTSRINEGRAHLSVNGEKRTRLYGPAHFLESLPKGEVEIRVTLNTNAHEELSHKGRLIEDVVEYRVEQRN